MAMIPRVTIRGLFQWRPPASCFHLKSTPVGAFTPGQLANAANQALLPGERLAGLPTSNTTASDSQRKEIHTKKRVHMGVNTDAAVWDLWLFLLCHPHSCNCPKTHFPVRRAGGVGAELGYMSYGGLLID